MVDRRPVEQRERFFLQRKNKMTGAVYCVLIIIGVSVRGVALPPRARAQSAPPHTESSPKIETLLHDVEGALNRRDFAAAVKFLESVVKLQPDNASAWFNLGYAYTGLGQNEDAVKAYRKTLELQPDLFEARLNLGILLVEMKRPQEALEHLERAAALKPRNARVHLYYARALAAAGQTDAAVKQFQDTLRIQPALAIAHFDLAQIDLQQKQFEEGRAEFEKAASLDPKLAPAQLGMALALEGLNRPADAAIYFEKYLALKPDDLETRFHLARIDLQQGENPEALDNLEKVYQANPNLAGLSAALGDVYALLKKFPESEKYYRQALDLTPGDADLQRALGKTLLDEGKLDEAEAEFRSALKINPQNQAAASGLAATLYLQKRYAETIPLLEAQARAPNPPISVFFVLATCYDHLRDQRKALANYERYLGLSHGEFPDQEWQAQQRAKLLRHMLEK
ncbi:MAG TPA: tetratricopeptide repeat protein [Terriglobia bacterium]|nr:tetratricopeptide repeat protein [Terriglobia bacterium]